MEFNNQIFNIGIWNEETGVLGRFVALDTETDIRPFTETPNLVTMQAYGGGNNVYYIPKDKIATFLDMHRDTFFIGQNFPFDADVISKFLGSSEYIYSKYDNCRIRDIGVLYRLYHLAELGFIPFKRNLQLLAKKFLNVDLIKDEVRENFGQFLNTPVEQIPREYLEYGAIDAIATYQIYFRLIPLIQPHDKYRTLLSQDIQVKGDLALLHIHKNGIGFDLAKRDDWLEKITVELDKHADILATWGWVRGRKGIKDVYTEIIEMLGLTEKLPKTESGEVSSKADDLAPFKQFQFINSYLEYQSLEKAMSFVKDRTSCKVHPKYNLLVNTGRTSCSSPNFQQLPKFGGIREMFIPSKPENTFIITDYSAIELATLAQVCYERYGYSEMRDKINEGVDLHSYYGTVYYGKAIEDITKQERQTCKAPNFGFPGGLGIDTFVEFSRGYGLELTKDEAQSMKDAWFNAFPEMDSYMQNEIGEVFTLTGRKRGKTTYCAEKNTPFQGLAADGAKIALYNLDKEGFRVVGFVHDEVICEVPREMADKLLHIQERILIDSMKEVVPDVKIGVESAISDYYTK